MYSSCNSKMSVIASVSEVPTANTDGKFRRLEG